MNYKDIDDDIKPFIGVDETTFNSLPEIARQAMSEGARVQWLKAGCPKLDSLRYPIVESVARRDMETWPIERIAEYYYEHHRKMTTLGIDDHRFMLRSSTTKPSLSQFVNIMIYQARELHATNVVVSYLDNDDMVQHLSFSKNDLNKHNVEELLNLLKKGSEEWGNDSLYTGSDTVRDDFKTYRLNIDHFEIIVKHTKGGYGKMIPDYYDVLGLENNENDCLIECFRYIHQQEHPDIDTPTVDEVRSILLREGKLGLDAVCLLEDYFQIKVSVVQDYHDVDIKYEGPDMKPGARLPPYTAFKAIVVKDEETYIHGDDQCQWKLLHKNDHYDVVIRSYSAKQCLCAYTGNMLPRRKPYPLKILKKKIIERYYIDHENLTLGGDSDHEEEKDVFYYFFDYETVFNESTMEIIPYAYAIVKCDKHFKVIEERYKIGLDCNKDLANYLYDETPNKETERKYLIGYNNSRFDNFILLKEAIKYNNYIGHVRFANNSIVSAGVNDFAIRDLCRLLNMPLDTACKAFNIALPKLTDAVQHHEVQFMYMEGEDRFNKYLMDYHNVIRNYVVRDCVCLAELYKITKETIRELVNLDVEESYTLASMSYKAFKSVTNVHELPVLNNSNINKDKFVRQAIIGGRTQMRHTEGKDMCAIDCVSLYPYVMLNRRYPVGLPMTTDVYVNDKIGVYNVIIKSQIMNKLNVVPLRVKDGRLDWDHKGEIECVLCSVDIECLIKNGAEINIKDGIYWENDRNDLFDRYFKPLIAEKKRQDELKESGSEEYNPAIREICKLLMNALSGKLAQRLYDTETQIVRNHKDVDRFFNRTFPGTQKLVHFGSKFIAQGKKEAIPNMPVIYGILIYAYAREHMYESVLKHLQPHELYGMDTDSAFLKRETLKKIAKHLFGNDFGQFKIEIDNVDGIFIAPKCYCFHRNDELVKARFKGVKVGKDVEIEEEIDDVIELYNYYHRNDNVKVGINTYKHLLAEREINIVCCNVEKAIVNKNKGLYLANHTFIKRIKMKENEVIGNDIVCV